MSDQTPPSEHDQLGWLMGEVDRLEAELEQARAEIDTVRDSYADLLAELEQARKERDEANGIIESLCFDQAETEGQLAQRWRAALEWYADRSHSIDGGQRARDALAGKGQT